MTFTLSTTGNWYDKDHKEKLETLGFKFRVEQGTYRTGDFYKVDEQELTTNINSIEDLVKFAEEWGDIIISTSTFHNMPGIEIYDDYRE